MVKVSSLSFSYGNGKLISDLSFMLETGRIMAILGPNGVGKTTLLKILAGLLKPAEGSFTAEKDITYVPQIFSTGVNYTVYNMVLLGRAGHIGLFSSPDENDREKALDAIKKTGPKSFISGKDSRTYGKPLCGSRFYNHFFDP
jgi:iron complex transport system ATP-binding protein